jgi:RNA polymerase sigma-70 factor (ECF subfamily)
MVSVLESMPRYRLSGAPFAAWVFRIARNRVIDTSRRRKRHPTIPLMLDVAAEEQVPEMVAQRVAVGEVRRQVDRLSPGQRAALLLLYFGGYNTAATARLIGKSEGAVKSLRFRGLIALRRLACGDETAAASQITV